jgi:hypothetical protein
VTPDEPFADLSDADLDEVLTGAASADARLWALGELVTDVRDACADPVEAPPAGLVAVLAATAAAAEPGVATEPRGRRRRLRPVVVVASTCAVALSLATGLAAADELPGPAQDVVARVAEAVGFELPGGGAAPERPDPARPADRGSARPQASRGPEAPDGPTRDPGGPRPSRPAAGPPGTPGASPPGSTPPAVTPPTQTPPSTRPEGPPGQDHRPPSPPGQAPDQGPPDGKGTDRATPGGEPPATTRPERPSATRSDKSAP